MLDATSKDRFPAAGLARFDLNEPNARVTVNQQTFSFGAINRSKPRAGCADAGQHTPGGQLRCKPAEKRALQLASRQLFAADEAPVAFGARCPFKLAQQDGKWQLTPAADAGPDDINRWVDEWRLATAIAVQAPSNRKPLATIKVKLKSGGDITLAVLQREPN